MKNLPNIAKRTRPRSDLYERPLQSADPEVNLRPGTQPLRVLYASLGRDLVDVDLRSDTYRFNVLQVFRILRLPPSDPLVMDKCVTPSKAFQFKMMPAEFVKAAVTYMFRLPQFPHGFRLIRRCQCTNCYNPWHFETTQSDGTLTFDIAAMQIRALFDLESWRDSPYYEDHKNRPLEEKLSDEEFYRIWRSKG